MTSLPVHTSNRNVAKYVTLTEAAWIDDLRCCPDRTPEVVTAAEQDLLRHVRLGNAEFAAHTARTLADTNLGLRDEVTR